MELKKQLLKAKINLYLLLIKLDEDTMTDDEADLMYLLARDEEIQNKFTH